MGGRPVKRYVCVKQIQIHILILNFTFNDAGTRRLDPISIGGGGA